MQQARRLVIGRGGTGEVRPLPRVGEAAPAPTAAPPPQPQQAVPAADLHLVHHRLVALERLAALREKGALSAEEFAAEKSLVLRVPVEELLLGPHEALPPRGPSLLGRILQPRLLAAGIVAGLALSAWVQPRELEALLRTFG